MARSEILDEIGSKHECGENYADCLVFLLGEMWSDKDTSIRVLPNGALLKVIYSLQEQDCDSSSYGTSPSSAIQHENAESESQLGTVDYNEESSLMQRMIQETAQRNAEDSVFRLLSGRLAFRHLPAGYGYTISLWAVHARNVPHNLETRVWLDATTPSWERTCVDAINSQAPGPHGIHPRWAFYVTTPSPFAERLPHNNVQLLCIPEAQQDPTALLLVDVFEAEQLRRVAIAMTEDTSVFTLATMLMNSRPEELSSFTFQLRWNTRDGELVLYDHDVIRFPLGAYVRLRRDARPRNDDGCSMLQTTFQTKKPTTAFRPYGHRGSYTDLGSNLSLWTLEGLHFAPTFTMLEILWVPSFPMCRRNRRHTPSFLSQADDSWLSFHRDATAGLRPPGNPETYTSFFDTLDDKDINEGVPIAKTGSGATLQLDQLLRNTPTPVRSQKILLAELLDVPPPPQRQAEILEHRSSDEALSPQGDASGDDPINRKISLDTRAETETFEEVLYFHPELHRLHQDWPPAETCHPVALDWLANHQILNYDTFDPHSYPLLQVHTDGSYNGVSSAWCFVLTLKDPDNQHYFLGYAAAKTQLDPSNIEFAGTTRHGASQAETEALHWASWWVIRFVVTHCWHGRVEFFWDAQVSGHKAMGLANAIASNENGPTASRMRSFQHALVQHLGPQGVIHAHTKAHAGDPLNELADTISKLANEQVSQWGTVFPAPCQIEALSPHVFTLLWYYIYQQQNLTFLPSMEDGTISWTTTSAPATEEKATLENWARMTSPFDTERMQENTRIHFSMLFGSYNVLSFGGKHERAQVLLDEPGRVALLRQQAHALHMNVLGIQEARTPKGAFHSLTHFRFSSGPQPGGVGGVELWISKTWPYARTEGGCLLFVQEEHLHLQHCEPTALFMNVVHLLLGVAHAPHSGHPQRHIEDWWQSLQRTIATLAGGRELVLLIDANARTDATVDSAFGGLSEDLQNYNGHCLREFTSTLGLCAPASFHHVQYGKLATWTHPGTGTTSRLDYVLCPQTWLSCTMSSWVEDSCNTGHAIPDHACTCLQVEWQELSCFRLNKKIPFDIQAMRQRQNAPVLAHIIQSAPQFGWQMNANEHAYELVQWLHGELAQAFPRTTSTRRKLHFASEETSVAHAQLTSSKRQCRAIMKMLRLQSMRRAFYAWSHQILSLNSRHWQHVLRLKFCRLKCEMGHGAHQLRLQLRKDRRDFIQQVATEANRSEPSEIFKKLKPILVTTKKQGAMAKTMPRLQKADGSFTQTREEMNQLWLTHFAALEAGTVMEPLEFFTKAINEQPHAILPTTWNASDLPQLEWIEHAVRKLQTGKTPGPDMIINEVFKSNPGGTARMLLPLMWKMVLRLQEPVIWKGGRLIPIYKKKGSHESCNSYRGILLMDSMGKLLRSAGRHLVAEPFFTNSDPMQLGGKPGMPVQFGSQAVRAFQGYAKSKSLSSSLIFADVQSAYYRAIRELATGHADEVSMRHLVHRFNLDEATSRTLFEALHTNGGQQQLGGSALQAALMAEGLSQTWFTCSGQEVVSTERGTRPGDAWADVAFAVIMHSVLQRIKARLQEADILVTFPQFDSTSVFEAKPTDQLLAVYNICWADDLALLVLSKDAASLPSKTTTATFIMVSTFNEFGMDLTIGEGKTAIVMTPRGKAAVKIRRQFFDQPKAHLTILLETKSIAVPLVFEYRHLGGQVTATAGMMPELRSRATKAKSAFWRAAKAVFKSKYLDLPTRKRLFQACVMSIWYWGCGSWPELNQAEQKFFVTTTWQLWAFLLPPRPEGADFWTHATIQEALNVSSPLCYLHEARLRHLGPMVRHGPQVLWSLVLSDTKMHNPLKAALSWCWQAIEGDCELPPMEKWEEWHLLIQKNPARWKHLVLLAALRHKRYELRAHQVTRWHHNLYQIFLDQDLVVDAPELRDYVNVNEYCILCDRSFKNRRAWFLHAFTTHGYKSQPGHNVQGDTCFVCQKQYPSTSSLQHHLRYSSRCNTAFALRRHELVDFTPEDKHRQCPWRPITNLEQTFLAEEPIDFELEAVRGHLDSVLAAFEIASSDSPDLRDPDDLARALSDGLMCALPFSRILEGFHAWIDSLRPLDSVVDHAVSHVSAWLDSLGPRYMTVELYGNLGDETQRRRHRMRPVSPLGMDGPPY